MGTGMAMTPAVQAQTVLPPRNLRDAYAALRGAQKSSSGGPAYSYLVNRPMGRVFAAIAYVLGQTPNRVTAVSAVFTFTAITMTATIDPSPITALATCLLLVIGYGLDAADGQLARLRGGGSVAGEWLDHVVDATKLATLHLAVLIGWYRFTAGSEIELLVPLGYAAVASVMFFVIMLNDQLRRKHRGTTGTLLEGSSPMLYRIAVLPTDYGFLCVAFAFRSWTDGFLWIYTALAAANAAFLLLALVKWYKEMRRYST